jgi:large repetitive protein
MIMPILLVAIAHVMIAQAPPPDGWICQSIVYDADDGCDCGCGAPDPDCPVDAVITDCYMNHCTLLDGPTPASPASPDPADVTACIANRCGDGVPVSASAVASGEVCDDGNNIDGDGCSDNCMTVDPGFICSFSLGQLYLGCWQTTCGDGRRDLFPSEGRPSEACDDGNTDDGDGCSADCQQVEPGYACWINNTRCAPTVCGDGRTDFDFDAESCDDGNADAGDGCSDDCRVEAGYDCDWFTSTYRPAQCALMVCGDELIEGAEACDDGNADAGDGCSDECLREEGFYCNTDNGLVFPAGGAQVGSDDRTGPSLCRAVVCGDGVRDPDVEVCDDGNTNLNDGCNADCFIENGFDCDNSVEPTRCTPYDPGEGEGEEGEGEEGEGEEGEGEPATGEGEGEGPAVSGGSCGCSSMLGGPSVALLVLACRRRMRR